MKCPGQDSRYWKPGAIFEAKCPKCGSDVEFFKDDTTRRCGSCGHRFLNPGMDFGCASYCQYAEQCIGNLPPELIAQKQDLLKDRVAVEMKRYFKNDFKRIGHTTRVARFAERIGRQEGGNLGVILTAAYLQDIGLKEAGKGDRGAAAREILTTLGAGEEMIAEVCGIISHHHPSREGEGVNFRCLYDADRLVNLEDEIKEGPPPKETLSALLERSFLTGSGLQIARELFLSQDAKNHQGEGR